jgi:hypothetical protein
MTIDATTLALPGADEWPLQPAPHPSPRQHLIDLTADEFAAAEAAVLQLRARKAAQEADRQRWQPVLDELAEIDDGTGDGAAMAARLIERAELCSWNEEEDERLTRLVVGIIEEAGWPVEIDRRRGRPDQVRINGYRIGDE